MRDERILSYQLARKLTEEDLEPVGAAGHLTGGSVSITNRDGWDGSVGASWDF